MVYEILIEERRALIVEIEADTLQEAREIAKDEHERLIHDLSSNEHIVDTEFNESGE